MENRGETVKEYFELQVLLNLANRVRNASTEIDFRIERRGVKGMIFFATLNGVLKASFLQLCHWTSRNGWEASGFSKFVHLENYCRRFLKTQMKQKSTQLELQILVLKLKDDLRSLGIEK